MRRGEGRVEKKNAPLKAEWKLTPAPKWLRVRPPSPPAAPPPGHVLPSFLKGGLGISVGVVGPAAAPSPPSSATRPPSPSLCTAAAAALARLRRHFSTAPHAPPCSRSGHRFGPAHSSAHPTPRYFFLSAARLRPRRTRPLAPAEESARPPPPPRPRQPNGLRPRLRRCGAEPAPELGSRKQQRPPLSSRGRAGPLPRPPAAEAGRARAVARSGQGLRAGAGRAGPRESRRRGSGCGRAPPPPPAQVTGPAGSRRGATTSAPQVPKLGSSTNPGDRIFSHCV